MSNSASGAAVSGNWRRRGGERERGMPRMCRCGEFSVIRTSKTYENPGRLFHCCPNGSEKDKNHLFKWTDESVVEEIEDMKEMIGNLELETRTCEAVVDNCGKKIEEMRGVVIGYEKELEHINAVVNGYEKELKNGMGELRSLKNILVCGFGMIAFYYCFMA